LPNKFSETTRVSVGSLSFEIQESARAAGNPELADMINGLSAQAIALLLQIDTTKAGFIHYNPDRPVYYLPEQQEWNAMQELESKDLVEFKEPVKPFRDFVDSLGLHQKRLAQRATNQSVRSPPMKSNASEVNTGVSARSASVQTP
jgi:hypothetical protein